jgi:hypothetical protein
MSSGVNRIAFLLVALVAAPAAAQGLYPSYDPYAENPLDPGSVSTPPGTGCQIGTSGCWPSSPPGPVTPPADVGATHEHPPDVIQPRNVPFYGTLPGVAVPTDQPILSPEEQQKVAQEEAQQKEQQQEAAQAERDQSLQQLVDQQQQIIEQQQQLLDQQQQLQQQQQKQQEQQEEPPQGQEENAPAPSPAP